MSPSRKSPVPHIHKSPVAHIRPQLANVGSDSEAQ
jgi:hypothetical protein